MSDDPQVWQRGDVVLDLYEVREVLHGGMGVVHRVHHRGWGLDLAVKTPRQELAATPAAMAGFEAEANHWVELGLHPNTVNCVYVRRINQVPRVFAEWVEGSSLAEAVADGLLYADGPDAAVARILDIAIQVAWGLEHAHRQGLVHQDVKPANVLLAGDGSAKVTDFGLAQARVAGAERGAATRFAGMTPAYCSPEQNRAATGDTGLGPTTATDVWSWALTVLEMFVGGPPTPFGQGAAHALDQYLEHGPRFAHAPPMPAALAGLLGHCFQEDLTRRPSELAVLTGELRDIHTEATGVAHARRTPTPATLLADGLSNQALSMLDLGKPVEAHRLWTEALKIDRRNSHAVHNFGLIRWRSGVLTDEDFVSDLDGVRASHGANPLDDRLLAQIHLERGDHAAAAMLTGVQAEPPDVDLTLTGHIGPVRSVAASERFVVSGGEDGTVRVWDLPGGHCLHVLTGHAHDVAAVAVNGTGLVALSGDAEGTVRVWDLETGLILHELLGHAGRVTAVAVAVDGRRALSGGVDGTVRMWDLRSGVRLHVLHGHEGAVSAVALGVHGRSYGVDKLVRVWDTETGRCVRTLRGLDIGDHVALGGDGLSALLVRRTELALVWEPEAGRETRILDKPYNQNGPNVMDDAGVVALSGDTTGMRVWELDTGRVLRTLVTSAMDHGGYVTTVAIRPDGLLGLWGRWNGGVRVSSLPAPGSRAAWSYAKPHTTDELDQAADVVDAAIDRADQLCDRALFAAAADELRVARRVPGHERNPRLLERWRVLGGRGRRGDLLAAWQLYEMTAPLAFMRPFTAAMAEDARHAVTGGHDGGVRMWDLATGQVVRTMSGHTGWVKAVATGDGMAVTASNDGTVRVWNLDDGRCTHTRVGHTSRVTHVVLEGRTALSADSEGTLLAWDPRQGRCVRVIDAHTGPVDAIALSRDGRYAASARAMDDSVQVWDLGTGKLRHTLKTLCARADVVISPDNRLVLSTCDVDSVRARDLRTGRRRYTVRSPGVHLLALSGEGQVACSGNLDGTVRVWDLRSGRVRHVLAAHDMVESLTISTDGRLAVSGGADRAVRIWDLSTGRCLQSMEGHADGVNAVALTADLRYVLSGDWSLTARFWELDWDYDFSAR